MDKSCNHIICKKEETIWFPTSFQNRSDNQRHPWCLSCGDIKNLSEDQPKPLGHWMNILGDIGYQLQLTQCQKRLIAKDLLNCNELCDTFGTFGSAQRDAFLSIIKKHCSVSIKHLNLDDVLMK